MPKARVTSFKPYDIEATKELACKLREESRKLATLGGYFPQEVAGPLMYSPLLHNEYRVYIQRIFREEHQKHRIFRWAIYLAKESSTPTRSCQQLKNKVIEYTQWEEKNIIMRVHVRGDEWHINPTSHLDAAARVRLTLEGTTFEFRLPENPDKQKDVVTLMDQLWQ